MSQSAISRRWFFCAVVVALATLAALALGACSSAAPTPTLAPALAPTAAPKAVEPTKAAAPTKAAEPTRAAEPSKAPAAQPTPAPVKQTDFPAIGRAITIIVPWPAGGAVDVGTRVVAAAMEKDLGVPVQIANKAGANSQVGLTELARSRPDGYTAGIVTLPNFIPTYLDPERQAAYGRKDFLPVALQVSDSIGLAVRPDSPYKTAKDLIDAAKAKPDTIKVGDSGIMSNDHLAILLLTKEANVAFSLVHFEGGPQALTALMGGHVDATALAGANYPPPVKSGQVRLLAITDKEKSQFFPGVQTLEDQGYKVTFVVSRGMCVPAGTPAEIVNILSQSSKKVLGIEQVQKGLNDLSLAPRYMGPTEYADFWDDSETRVKAVMDLAKK